MAADGCGDAEAASPMEPRRRDMAAPARARAGLAARLFAGLSLIGLCGCASTADFGRLNDVLVTDDVHAWVGEEAATHAGRPISANNLTEAERTLRDLAFPLIEPPYDRLRWDAVVLEYGTRRKFVDKLWVPDTSAYYLHLQNALLRTSAARYNTLIDDIRNDIDRITPFYQTARAVVELDRRRQSTLDLVQTLTPAERINAEARIGENSLVITWVNASLQQRCAEYRFALEHLAVAEPEMLAGDADRVLLQLQQQLAATQVVIASPKVAGRQLAPFPVAVAAAPPPGAPKTAVPR